MKRALCIAVFCFVVSLFSMPFYCFGAYKVSWMYVQHRSYQDGRSFNVLSFGMEDTETGEAVKDYSIIRKVSLQSPDGAEVNLLEPLYGSEMAWYCRYDGNVGRWYYDRPRTDSWYFAKFNEELQKGTYRLRIVTADGQEIVGEYTYNEYWEDMPIFDVKSFRFKGDDLGNLWWYWDVPKELYLMRETRATSVRAIVDVYNDENPQGYLYITLPTHMGNAFIP